MSDYSDFEKEIEQMFRRRRVYMGQKVKATVVAVNKTEAVVDIGIKHIGYIPAEEISLDKSLTPEEAVKVGDVIDCIITKVNSEDGVVYLSRRLAEDKEKNGTQQAYYDRWKSNNPKIVEDILNQVRRELAEIKPVVINEITERVQQNNDEFLSAEIKLLYTKVEEMNDRITEIERAVNSLFFNRR